VDHLEWSYAGARVYAVGESIRFEGDLSGVELIPLRADLVEFAEEYQNDTLTADLSGVERLEHTGLSILDAMRDTLEMRGKHLVLTSLSKPALQMLVTTNLSQRFRIS
jgi:ABC-type transporter Mla MlaB component